MLLTRQRHSAKSYDMLARPSYIYRRLLSRSLELLNLSCPHTKYRYQWSDPRSAENQYKRPQAAAHLQMLSRSPNEVWRWQRKLKLRRACMKTWKKISSIFGVEKCIPAATTQIYHLFLRYFKTKDTVSQISVLQEMIWKGNETSSFFPLQWKKGMAEGHKKRNGVFEQWLRLFGSKLML